MTDAQQVVTCSGCDKYISFYCNSCHIGICVGCRENHLTEEGKGDHNIVPYKDRNVVIPLKECKKHPRKSIDLLCRDCEIPVCSTCTSDWKHKGHVFDDIETLYNKKLTTLMKKVTDLRNVVSSRRSILKGIEERRDIFKDHIARIRKQMFEKSKVLKNFVEEILSDLSKTLEEDEKSIQAEFEDQGKLMNDHITFLSKTVEEYKEEILSKSPTDLILFKKQIDQLEDSPVVTGPHFPMFADFNVDKSDIKIKFGSITKPTIPAEEEKKTIKSASKTKEMVQSSSATLRSTISINGLEAVFHMSLVKSKEFWMSDGNGNLVLVDKEGNKFGKISTCKSEHGYHTATKKHDLLYADEYDQCIRKVEPDQTTTVVISLKNVFPISIYCSKISKDLLVGMRFDTEKERDGKETPKSKIIRYNSSYKEKQTIQYGDARNLMYNLPNYITENKVTEDIITSDLSKKEVVVVNKSGKYLFSYPDSKSVYKDSFCPYGVASDIIGNILVCDGFRVHLLDKDGQFLSVIVVGVNHKMKTLRGLCLTKKHKLWLSQGGVNVVKVFKYLQEKNEH